MISHHSSDSDTATSHYQSWPRLILLFAASGAAPHLLYGGIRHRLRESVLLTHAQCIYVSSDVT